MIVTIDGPAGAGKSTAARLLAVRLGFTFLDTGAMYRAVALALLEAGGNADTDEETLAQLVAGLRIEVAPGRVRLNGRDVYARLRQPEVTRLTSRVADSYAVRRRLSALQRQYAAESGLPLVSEGRDQGTEVFPDAAAKFFLTASPLERAHRRYRELHARGDPSSIHEVLAQQEERDRRDAARPFGRLVPAADAVQIDTTGLDAEAVVDLLERHVRARLAE